MKKFYFSMQSVKNVRDAEKRAREVELRDAQAELREETFRLQEINKKIEETKNLKAILHSRSIYYLLQRERYLTRLKNLLKEQKYRVEKAKAQVAVAMRKLQVALMELKKMEKLRDREFETWNLEFKKEEIKDTDEKAVILSFIKKRSYN